MRLGPKIRCLRGSFGYSQQYVAEALHLSQNQVSKWESGKNTPHLNQMCELARLFDVPLDYLADDDLDEPPLIMTADERDLLEVMRRAGLTPVRVLEVLVRAGLIRDLPPRPPTAPVPPPAAPKRPPRGKSK